MFIVIEVQTSDKVATIVNAYDQRDEAESRFHQILASAAVSEVPKHGAVMMTDEGALIKRDCYIHVDDEDFSPEPDSGEPAQEANYGTE